MDPPRTRVDPPWRVEWGSEQEDLGRERCVTGKWGRVGGYRRASESAVTSEGAHSTLGEALHDFGDGRRRQPGERWCGKKGCPARVRRTGAVRTVEPAYKGLVGDPRYPRDV